MNQFPRELAIVKELFKRSNNSPYTELLVLSNNDFVLYEKNIKSADLFITPDLKTKLINTKTLDNIPHSPIPKLCQLVSSYNRCRSDTIVFGIDEHYYLYNFINSKSTKLDLPDGSEIDAYYLLNDCELLISYYMKCQDHSFFCLYDIYTGAKWLKELETGIHSLATDTMNNLYISLCKDKGTRIISYDGILLQNIPSQISHLFEYKQKIYSLSYVQTFFPASVDISIEQIDINSNTAYYLSGMNIAGFLNLPIDYNPNVLSEKVYMRVNSRSLEKSLLVYSFFNESFSTISIKLDNIGKIEPISNDEVLVISSDKNTEIKIINNDGFILDEYALKGRFISSAMGKDGTVGILTEARNERIFSVISSAKQGRGDGGNVVKLRIL